MAPSGNRTFKFNAVDDGVTASTGWAFPRHPGSYFSFPNLNFVPAVLVATGYFMNSWLPIHLPSAAVTDLVAGLAGKALRFNSVYAWGHPFADRLVAFHTSNACEANKRDVVDGRCKHFLDVLRYLAASAAQFFEVVGSAGFGLL